MSWQISGMSEAALEKFGPALLDRLVSFLATCTHLKHDAADWNVVERTSKMVKEIQGPGGASYEVDDAGVVLARALSNGVKGAASSAAAKYEVCGATKGAGVGSYLYAAWWEVIQ